MGSWLRAGAGIALVALVAVAGILANFALLRLTQDSRDPVGRLSPRAVFLVGGTSPSAPGLRSTADADELTGATDRDD